MALAFYADRLRGGVSHSEALPFFGGLLMFLLHTLRRMISRPRTPRRRHWPGRDHPLLLEPLEDRLCPSGGYLFVDSYDTNSVLRYDESTGAFVDTFVPKGSGGLYSPGAMIFGP